MDIKCHSNVLEKLQVTGNNIIPASIVHLGPRLVRQHSFVEIDHEIFFSVIFLLIQEEQLSVSGERMCTSTG